MTIVAAGLHFDNKVAWAHTICYFLQHFLTSGCFSASCLSWDLAVSVTRSWGWFCVNLNLNPETPNFWVVFTPVHIVFWFFGAFELRIGTCNFWRSWGKEHFYPKLMISNYLYILYSKLDIWKCNALNLR